MNTANHLKPYDAYKPSGIEWIGEIPVHWVEKPLFAISKIKSITNSENKTLLSVYLDLGVVEYSDIDEKRTNATSTDLSKYQLVSKGNFVLNNQQAWRGSVGVSNHDGIVSPAYIVLELSGEMDSTFSNYLFRSRAMVSQYLILKTASLNLHISHAGRVIKSE